MQGERCTQGTEIKTYRGTVLGTETLTVGAVHYTAAYEIHLTARSPLH